MNSSNENDLVQIIDPTASTAPTVSRRKFLTTTSCASVTAAGIFAGLLTTRSVQADGSNQHGDKDDKDKNRLAPGDRAILIAAEIAELWPSRPT